MGKWTKSSIADDEIIKAATSSITMSLAALKLGINFKAFMRRAKKLGVYIPNQSRVGLVIKKNENEIISGNHTMRSTVLKTRLINLGLKEDRCEHCKLNEWMGKKLIMELEHIDGDHSNNELSNLKILCPNCHSQTSTWRGKGNTGNKKRTDEEIVESLKNTKNIHETLKELNMPPAGNHYQRIYKIIVKNKLEYLFEMVL